MAEIDFNVSLIHDRTDRMHVGPLLLVSRTRIVAISGSPQGWPDTSLFTHFVLHAVEILSGHGAARYKDDSPWDPTARVASMRQVMPGHKQPG